ncbi:efflux RND transporter periplasmic adaptor subunit [Pelagicoccus sp. SDUM812005]|uniref:efflux RND transporter periplasmic adaptor subunit n=1 Tax=Pelagicoccus sp. SDUM812005 TaxID=3041257 RepID=UPI00280E16D7|nr:efflux RND transporter periplasmic adaptor subunit [Pelagicoccus sp. SDUM812005]MDQ8179535.1 efflux RND transporter periplasmic adaptor subunit [Pelagicoccus sp. SDUM812005]
MEEKEYRPNFPQWLLLHVLPAILLILFGGAAIIALALFLKRPPETKPLIKVVPTVEVIEAQPTTTRAVVESQGIVEARTQTTLFAEVSGRIESVSPALYAGGFFAKGDVLAKIDDTDYVANLAAAKSRQAEAQLAYEQERATSEQALEDWKQIGSGEAPSDLVLRKPQLARALANLEAATAAVKSAERDLQRASVKAPYDGRVQSKFVDIGQFVNARTSQIASIYAVDTVEVRLGISLDDTRLISIPEAYADGTTSGKKPPVTLTATYGGKDYQWEGIIDRSEGSVDPQTRLLYLVAQVSAPYAKGQGAPRPPLKIGSFVKAEIIGEQSEDSYTLPRRALRENDSLYIVKEDRTLEIREVTPFQKTRESVIIKDGLEPGELVCLTPLQYVVNGMEVRLPSDPDPHSQEEDGTDSEANAKK